MKISGLLLYLQKQMIMYDNELAELSNALHLLKAYEKDGGLDVDELVEDRDFGTYDSINSVYVAAKNLVEKLNSIN